MIAASAVPAAPAGPGVMGAAGATRNPTTKEPSFRWKSNIGAAHAGYGKKNMANTTTSEEGIAPMNIADSKAEVRALLSPYRAGRHLHQ